MAGNSMPQWLYASLPYLYVIGGIGCLVSLETVFGTLSGALLIAAGLLVWLMRRQGRRDAQLRTFRR